MNKEARTRRDLVVPHLLSKRLLDQLLHLFHLHDSDVVVGAEVGRASTAAGRNTAPRQ